MYSGDTGRAVGPGGLSARQIPNTPEQLLVARVGIHDGRERRHVPGESLGQEEVSACPVDVCDGGVAQCMDGVEPIEPGDPLPVLEDNLEP
jgi:hypothetical protein